MIDLSAVQLLLMGLTGWLERREPEAIAYLVEVNRCLRRQVGGRRLGLTDTDRRLTVPEENSVLVGAVDVVANRGDAGR